MVAVQFTATAHQFLHPLLKQAGRSLALPAPPTTSLPIYLALASLSSPEKRKKIPLNPPFSKGEAKRSHHESDKSTSCHPPLKKEGLGEDFLLNTAESVPAPRRYSEGLLDC